MKVLLFSMLAIGSSLAPGGEARPAPAPGEAGKAPAPQVVPVKAEFLDRSWFTDRMATTVVKFPAVVETPEEAPDGGDEVFIADVEIREAGEGGGSVAVVRWVPKHDGVVDFPALVFQSGNRRFATSERQILVSRPQKSAEMKLVFTPGKKRVYVGEPLRLDVAWTCRLSTKRLMSLRCNPGFMAQAGIEVIVPRCTAPENEQLGMPFGGRRVIARRKPAATPDWLGEVSFPLFLRFAKPGHYNLPPARIECASLREGNHSFAPYAAYFNNALFEPVEEGTAYDRLFTDSNPLEIEVLPLPETGRTELFSGLFAPCTISLSVRPTDAEAGSILDATIHVRSSAPSGFLDLPELRRQRSLRSWFKIDGGTRRIWNAQGADFRARLRPLTTRIKAFPALEFQVFDPDRGRYAVVKTAAVPLTVRPCDGRDYFDAKRLARNASGLSDQPEGIWQNARKDPMNDMLNTISGMLADSFWLWMAAGPVLFFALLPWVLDRRRRAMNPAYRKLVEAYRAFRRMPEGGAGKWRALREVLAAGLGSNPKALTAGDVLKRLEGRGIPRADLEVLLGSGSELDAEEFSRKKKSAVLPRMDEVGKRLFKVLKKLVIAAVLMLMAAPAASDAASAWDHAESLFAEALQQEPGSSEAAALFSRAALSFEASARGGERPGAAWYNAGNAWFEAGEIGRSIACFRQAEVFRPFDPDVRKNLAAARALATDAVEHEQSRSWLVWPERWLRAAMVPAAIVFWLLLLVFVRYRKPAILAATAVCFAALAGLGALAVVAKLRDAREGVVVAPEVYARKGPSFRYRTAFREPLHDGLEFHLVERRGDWLRIQLPDKRDCWVPSSQVRLIHLGSQEE